MPEGPLDPLDEAAPALEDEDDIDEIVNAHDKSEDPILLSAKARELVRLLQGAGQEGCRSLVFSQWTTHIDLLGRSLDEAGIEWVRFDGSMSVSKRNKVIDEFQAGRGPAVMVLSLHAAALGLNLTAARCVQRFALRPT